MEGHARLQVVRVVHAVRGDEAVRACRDILGQARLQGGVLPVVHDERVEDLVDDLAREEVVRAGWIEADHLVRCRDIQHGRSRLVDDEPLEDDRVQLDVLHGVDVGSLRHAREQRNVWHVVRQSVLDLGESVRPNVGIRGALLLRDPLIDLRVVVERSEALCARNREERRGVVVRVEVVGVPAEKEHRHTLVRPVLLVDGPRVGFQRHRDPPATLDAVLERQGEGGLGVSIVAVVVVPKLDPDFRGHPGGQHRIGADADDGHDQNRNDDDPHSVPAAGRARRRRNGFSQSSSSVGAGRHPLGPASAQEQ